MKNLLLIIALFLLNKSFAQPQEQTRKKYVLVILSKKLYKKEVAIKAMAEVSKMVYDYVDKKSRW